MTPKSVNNLSLARWLDSKTDKRHCHNWSIIHDDHLRRYRVWMVLMPRGTQASIKFLMEFYEHENIRDITDDYRDLKLDELDFWYDCQRVYNDW